MTTAKKPPAKKAVAKKTVAQKAVAKKTVARKPAPKKERKLGAVVMSVVEPQPVRRRKRVAKVVAPVTPAPVAPSVQLAPAKAARPLVAKERARRKVTLPFRERLEHAMHRELKHAGPVCHPCRMNASRLAALATG